MSNITLSIPADLKKQMERYGEINWSEVARQAIVEKVRTLVILNKMLARSGLKEVDIEKAAAAIKKRVLKSHQRR